MKHYEDHVKPFVVREFAGVLAVVSYYAGALLRHVHDHLRDGGAVSQHWLKITGHLDQFYRTADHETLHAVERVNAVATHAQQTAIHAAVQDLADDLDDSDDLDDDDVDGIVTDQAQKVGRASNGQKLIVLFSGAPRVVRQRLEETIPAALMADPVASRTLVQDASKQAVGAGLEKTLTIARTEITGLYRDTQHRAAQTVENLIGWYWMARADCCPACGAMHGTFHDMREALDSHPRCRCYPRYVYRKETVETGEERFAGMDEDEQRAILGKKKFDLYRQGKIRLSDCVVKTRSDEWGPGIREASADEALDRAAKRS